MDAFDLDASLELTRFDAYYRYLAGQAGADLPPAQRREPVALFLVNDLAAERRPALAARSEAIQRYRATLATIGEAHQKLYDQRDQLSRAELLAQTRQYAGRIRAALRSLHGG